MATKKPDPVHEARLVTMAAAAYMYWLKAKREEATSSLLHARLEQMHGAGAMPKLAQLITTVLDRARISSTEFRRECSIIASALEMLDRNYHPTDHETHQNVTEWIKHCGGMRALDKAWRDHKAKEVAEFRARQTLY
jgi:hypothetical protein